MNQLKSSLDGTSEKLLYFFEQTLQEDKFSTALLYDGANHLLDFEVQHFVKNLMENLKDFGLNFKSAGVTIILLSGIAVNSNLTNTLISSLNQLVPDMR